MEGAALKSGQPRDPSFHLGPVGAPTAQRARHLHQRHGRLLDGDTLAEHCPDQTEGDLVAGRIAEVRRHPDAGIDVDRPGLSSPWHDGHP